MPPFWFHPSTYPSSIYNLFLGSPQQRRTKRELFQLQSLRTSTTSTLPLLRVLQKWQRQPHQPCSNSRLLKRPKRRETCSNLKNRLRTSALLTSYSSRSATSSPTGRLSWRRGASTTFIWCLRQMPRWNTSNSQATRSRHWLSWTSMGGANLQLIAS